MVLREPDGAPPARGLFGGCPVATSQASGRPDSQQMCRDGLMFCGFRLVTCRETSQRCPPEQLERKSERPQGHPCRGVVREKKPSSWSAPRRTRGGGRTQLGARASDTLAPSIMVCFCRGSPKRPVLAGDSRHRVIHNLSVLTRRPCSVRMQTSHSLQS